jgi:uncharacterized protein YdaU (DUF1376 family)
MPGENPSELKVNLWMPLDIGPFLQDTAHLSSEEIGAYTLLLLYYWAHGPLPNDPKRLANIAKMSVDTWSITHESLSMFFFVGSDGLLHQKGADRRRAEWLDKRLKAREKALKAINARWSKHRAKLASMGNTPSIPQEVRGEIPEKYPTSVVQEQKQRHPPPTPSAGAAGDKAKKTDTPSIPKKPPGPAGSTAQELPEVTPPRRSVSKAKTRREAQGARPNGRMNGEPHPWHNSATAVPAKAAVRGLNAAVRPTKADPRREGMKSEVLAYWEAQNPDGPELHFDPADDRALDALLAGHLDLTQAGLKKLLVNRFNSEVNPAALPRKWLRNILEYAAGPLGKYGKPLAPPRVL